MAVGLAAAQLFAHTDPCVIGVLYCTAINCDNSKVSCDQNTQWDAHHPVKQMRAHAHHRLVQWPLSTVDLDV